MPLLLTMPKTMHANEAHRLSMGCYGRGEGGKVAGTGLWGYDRGVEESPF